MKASANKDRFQVGAFIISLLITIAVGVVASLFTTPQIPGWYSSLNKPSFNPPNWVFAPVWTTLYILIAIAAYLVWKKRTDAGQYKAAKSIYIIQLGLNFWWSIVFFGMHQIFVALVIIVLLWICILLNISYFSRFSKVAAYLLVPYLLWVSFASLLNFSIYMLNH